jgi:hypothetical protein
MKHLPRNTGLTQDVGTELGLLFDEYGMVDASVIQRTGHIATGLALSHREEGICRKFQKEFDGTVRKASKTTWQWRVSGQACSIAAGMIAAYCEDSDVKALLLSLVELRNTLTGSKFKTMQEAQAMWLSAINELKYVVWRNREAGIKSPPVLMPEEITTPKPVREDSVEDWFGEGAVLMEDPFLGNEASSSHHNPDANPSTPRQTSVNEQKEDRFRNYAADCEAGRMELKTEPEPQGRDPFELMEQLKQRSNSNQSNE